MPDKLCDASSTATISESSSSSASISVSKLRSTITAARTLTMGQQKKKKKQKIVEPNPISADLAAASAAAASRKLARADGGEGGGDPRQKVYREKIRQQLRERDPDPATPLEVEMAAVAAARELRMRARADGGGNGGDRKARALRRVAQLRLRQRELELAKELIGDRSAARVAIVGAGPVGLWLGVLLARKHATLANGKDGSPVIIRNCNAPTIDIFEARQPNGGGDGGGGGGSKAHGTRSIVLAITQQTQELLNRQLIGQTIGQCGTHAFAPTSRIGEIERVLLREFERYSAAGFGKVRWGEDVRDPDELHEEAKGAYDVVFVASGRRNATDEWRSERGMETIVEGTAAAAIFEFWGARPAADGWSSVVAAASRAISPAQIFLRPGSDEGRGWVWLVGLPEQLSEAIHRGVSSINDTGGGSRNPPKHASLAAALEAALAAARSSHGGQGQGDDASSFPAEASSLDGLRTMDAALKAQGASAGWTEASHWRSSGVLHAPQGSRGPTILVGDAACGRPFWLGSTLNGHFADVAQLAAADCWRAWDWSADGDAPLRGYLDRMRTLRRCGAGRVVSEFKRPSAEAGAKQRWEASRQLSRSLGHKGGLGGAVMADYAKSAAAAEMRNRARAVGVNRASLVGASGSASMLRLKHDA